jgi:hypothetical protein
MAKLNIFAIIRKPVELSKAATYSCGAKYALIPLFHLFPSIISYKELNFFLGVPMRGGWHLSFEYLRGYYQAVFCLHGVLNTLHNAGIMGKHFGICCHSTAQIPFFFETNFYYGY